MPDPIFAEPILARLYDPLDPDRGDLDAYESMLSEFAATSVLDLGCGTGTLACRLAARGVQVIGVDPAAASLDIARAKPFAASVRWLCGDATDLPPLALDAATMTGNVAQVFVTDDAWAAALGGVRAALRPGGHLLFETREPARRAWLDWHRAATFTRTRIDGVGVVEAWTDLLDVSGPLVTFRRAHRFAADATIVTSDSTLRFRSREEVIDSLMTGGYAVEDVRGAPDRPGHELVFVARRA